MKSINRTITDKIEFLVKGGIVLTFSEFAKMMYPYIGEGMTKFEFVIFLTNSIIEKPHDNDNDGKERYNPFSEIGQSMIEKIWRGTREIKDEYASKVLFHLDPDEFRTYLLTRSPDILSELGNEMEDKGIVVYNNAPETCTNIFISILKRLANNEEISPEELQKRIDNINQRNVRKYLLGLHKRAEKDPSIANKIDTIFKYGKEGCSIRDFANPFSKVESESLVDDIYRLFENIYSNCIDEEIYDDICVLFTNLDNYIIEEVDISEPISDYKTDRLREIIIEELVEICSHI